VNQNAPVNFPHFQSEGRNAKSGVVFHSVSESSLIPSIFPLLFIDDEKRKKVSQFREILVFALLIVEDFLCNLFFLI
jgi:hypothetical protein